VWPLFYIWRKWSPKRPCLAGCEGKCPVSYALGHSCHAVSFLNSFSGSVGWYRGTFKGDADFPQGHQKSLARDRTSLQSLRSILKLSSLGKQPWFAWSFHRLIEFLDLNYSRFSQAVLFASSEVLQSQAGPPGPVWGFWEVWERFCLTDLQQVTGDREFWKHLWTECHCGPWSL
jgi:hypothetical protein